MKISYFFFFFSQRIPECLGLCFSIGAICWALLLLQAEIINCFAKVVLQLRNQVKNACWNSALSCTPQFETWVVYQIQHCKICASWYALREYSAGCRIWLCILIYTDVQIEEQCNRGATLPFILVCRTVLITVRGLNSLGWLCCSCSKHY